MITACLISSCSVTTMLTTFNFDFHVSHRVFSAYSCNDMLTFQNQYKRKPVKTSAKLTGLDIFPDPLPVYVIRNVAQNVALAAQKAFREKGCKLTS